MVHVTLIRLGVYVSEFLINSNVRWGVGDLKSNLLNTQFMFLKSLEIKLNLHPSKKNVECSMIIHFKL